MAQLFLRSEKTEGGERPWRVAPLEGDAYALASRDGVLALEPLAVEGGGSAAGVAHDIELQLLRREAADGDAPLWVALTRSSDVALNGRALDGIAVLADRDELRVGRESAFLSFERKATVEIYPVDDEPTCPRCRQAIVAGQPAVCCPTCELWSHQDEPAARPCWLYAERCAGCGRQPTAFDTEFRFHPADL